MTRSGGRTPRAEMSPRDDHLRDDRRRRAGVDIHADLPRGNARHMAVEDLLDCLAMATAPRTVTRSTSYSSRAPVGAVCG